MRDIDARPAAAATARLAGALYLLCAVTGFFTIITVPAAFVVPSDAAETARRITSAEFTYRLGLLSGLTAEVSLVALVVTLYALLADVYRPLAQAMVALVTISAAIGVVNVILQASPLFVLHDGGALSAFTPPQREALALACLRLRGTGIQVQSAFWGLWLIPFGLLVVRSPRFPQALGVVVVAAGGAYLASMCAALMAPAWLHAVNQVAVPLEGVGEISAIVWLLVRGVRASGRM